LWQARKRNKRLDSIAAIFRQINEAITPFVKPDDPRAKIQIHELILITSQDITDEAQQYIYENSGKCFPNIQYIDGHRLTHLINEVILEYNKNKSENYIFSVETFSSICNAPEIESVSSSASAVIEGSMAN
jgi:AAA+ ATPase superfamily predicted ATPase